MLDENLPTIYSKPSTEKPKTHSTLYNYQGGAEPEPIYSVRHLDPASPNARNRYAIALYDPYSPEILYGEVLLVPKWTQPSFSQEAIRANGGVQPPPEPILPTEFTIQLYNPEQQVLVRYKPSSWNTPATWSFEMPQQTFRQPSASQIDRGLNAPAISDTTSRLRFNWRRDGKLSKDLGCYLSGKVVDPAGKSKKSKEPDITIAIFQALREITLYEPNFYRVEMEDFKGLEIVLMLGALVIRDVYFGQMKECFHISDPPSNPTSPIDRPFVPAAGQPNVQNTKYNTNQTKPVATPIPQNTSQTKPPTQPQTYPPPQHPSRSQKTNQKPPPTDPRTQWELDAESRALKQQAEAEARERQRKEKEAEKRTQKLLQAEEKAARKRQAQIDKETERLKKLYGQEDNVSRQRQSAPPFPPRPTQPQQPPQQPPRVSFQPPPMQPAPWPVQTGGLMPPQPKMKEKRSIFGLRKKEGGSSPTTLMKKRSSMF